MSARTKRFAICVKNQGYEASLELRKIYEVLPDAAGETHRQIRVVDESGSDYLYPSDLFAAIELPKPLRRAVLSAV